MDYMLFEIYHKFREYEIHCSASKLILKYYTEKYFDLIDHNTRIV